MFIHLATVHIPSQSLHKLLFLSSTTLLERLFDGSCVFSLLRILVHLRKITTNSSAGQSSTSLHSIPPNNSPSISTHQPITFTPDLSPELRSWIPIDATFAFSRIKPSSPDQWSSKNHFRRSPSRTAEGFSSMGDQVRSLIFHSGRLPSLLARVRGQILSSSESIPSRLF